jgi:hypothetical protein
VNSKGDTCIKPLSGNGAGIVFAELLGADMYGVAVNESAVFVGGKLASKTALTGECGCPAPPVQAAQSGTLPSEESPRKSGTPGDVTAPLPPDRPGATHLEVNTPFVFSAKAAGDARPSAIARIEFSSLPNVYFVQDEAPTVVLTEKPAEVSAKQEKPKALPESQAKKQEKPKELPESQAKKQEKPKVLPESQAKKEEKPKALPESQAKKEKKGFMGRVKGFFGSIFHR